MASLLEQPGDVMLEDGEETRLRRRVHLYLSTETSAGSGEFLVTTRCAAIATPTL
jgi:hypothetical protein|tara:strand:+ start:315 stop:479 length:165 start_codon:yes stop_codon:yes gene_type:complete